VNRAVRMVIIALGALCVACGPGQALPHSPHATASVSSAAASAGSAASSLSSASVATSPASAPPPTPSTAKPGSTAGSPSFQPPSGSVAFVVATGQGWSAPVHPDRAIARQLAARLRSAVRIPRPPQAPPARSGLNVLASPSPMQGWKIGFTGGAPPVSVLADVVRCSAGAGGGGLECVPAPEGALIDGRAMAAPGLIALLTPLTAHLPAVPALTLISGPGALLSIAGQGWVGPTVTLSLTWCVPGQQCGGGNQANLGTAAVAPDGTFSWTALLPTDVPAKATATSVNAADRVRVANANVEVPPGLARAAPDPGSPIRFVVDTRMPVPTFWSAPLRATAATAAALERLDALIRAARPGPPLAAGPYPQVGLNRAQVTAMDQERFIVGLADSATPLTIDTQVVDCTPAAAGPDCTDTSDYVLIDGRPMTAPGLSALLTGSTAALPGVPPLQPHLQGNTLTVSGQGWLGARVTLSLLWCSQNSCGGIGGIPVATIPVQANGTFTWRGSLPPPPSGSSRPDFTLNATDGVRTAESLPSFMFGATV